MRAEQECRPHDAQPNGRGGGERAELGVHKRRVSLGLAEKQHVKAQPENERPIQGQKEPFHQPTSSEGVKRFDKTNTQTTGTMISVQAIFLETPKNTYPSA
ncbi:MAG: hypothetical protein MZV70_56510 [Desulfobacterales bacterium]|nr:hypothetical protein [Desulfobacterales bacterium]